MVFDYAGVVPNPARDKRVKLPQEDRLEVNPPTAGHVEAVYGLLPRSYRLALLVLDATGMRVGELEALAWGDVDEHEGRWRVTSVGEAKAARWVPVPENVFQAVTEEMSCGRIVTSAARYSQDSAPTGSAPRSRGPARHPGCRRSRRTTYDIAGRRCGTCRVSLRSKPRHGWAIQRRNIFAPTPMSSSTGASSTRRTAGS